MAEQTQQMDDMRGAYEPPTWEKRLGWMYLPVFIAIIGILLYLPMNAKAYTITLTLTPTS